MDGVLSLRRIADMVQETIVKLYQLVAHRLESIHISWEEALDNIIESIPTKRTSLSAGAFVWAGRSIPKISMPETMGLTK